MVFTRLNILIFLFTSFALEVHAQEDSSLTYGVIKIRGENEPRRSIFKEVSIGFKSGPSKLYFKGRYSLHESYQEDVMLYFADKTLGQFATANNQRVPPLIYFPSLYLNFTNHKVFSFQVELNYLKHTIEQNITTKGFLMNQFGVDEYFIFDYKEAIHLQYLEVPFLLKIKAYHIKAEPYFSIGFSPAFLLKSEQKFESTYQGSPEIKDSLKKYSADLENSKTIFYNPIGFNLICAVGNHLYISKKLKLNFEARYSYNLLDNIFVAFDNSYAQVNSRILAFTLGLQYNFNFENSKVPKIDKVLLKKKREHFEKIYQNTFYLNHLSLQSSYANVTANTKNTTDENLLIPRNGYSVNVSINYMKTFSPYFGIETGLAFGSKEYFYRDWKRVDEVKGLIHPLGTLMAGFFYHYNFHKKFKAFISAGINASTYFESNPNFDSHVLIKSFTGSNPHEAILIENNYSRYGIATYQKAGIIYKLKNYHILHLNLISNYHLQKFKVGDYTAYNSTGITGTGTLYGENFSLGVEVGFSMLNFLRFAK